MLAWIDAPRRGASRGVAGYDRLVLATLLGSVAEARVKKIDRRTFVVESAKAGSALAGISLLPGVLVPEAHAAGAPPDISVVTGEDTFQATIRAVQELGGMSRFVSKGDRVGLLANTWATKPGTFTRPEVVLAVAQLCFEAGAKQVVSLKDEDDDYWERTPLAKQHAKLITRLKPSDTDHVTTKIPGAKVLKEADVLKGALAFERLINLPIIKDHSGVRMTATLKNMMGLCPFSTNVKFHFGTRYVLGAISELGDFYNDIAHLSQCIADLNRVRTVDLCVVDATRFVTTNGPTGPGKLRKASQIVAGTDRVGVDAFCCSYLGLSPGEIGMIRMAHAHGLGQMDPAKLVVKQAKL